MKTLVAYYSRTGRTRAAALALAKAAEADTQEIVMTGKNAKLGVIKGAWMALRKKPAKIEPLGRLSKYNRIIVVSPVWAGNPPPAVNAFLDCGLGGRQVYAVTVSGSGKAEKHFITAIEKHGGKCAKMWNFRRRGTDEGAWAEDMGKIAEELKD